jgi:phospholipid/cholesterol/gamma-HCH transport system substrate-binding protein
MKSGRSALDLWVGIFVAIGIGCILFLALKVGNLVTFGSTEGYRLEARFDNIGGLKVRAPAKAAGVVVGRAKIDHAYPFTTDTIASIFTSGLLGEVYVGLEAGGDATMLPDGGKIAKTQSALVLEKLIGQFLFDRAATSGGK